LAIVDRLGYAERAMPKPSDELLEKVMEIVQGGPRRVPSVLEAVSPSGDERGQARAAIEHLVQRGDLHFDVKMMLRPAQS
jgi:hypothetical protein